MQGLAPDRVLSIGSVSTSLAPAMRLGWVVCSPALTAAIAEEKRIADRGSPGLDQVRSHGSSSRVATTAISAECVVSTAPGEALAEHAPTADLSGLAAGLHAVIAWPGSLGEREVVEPVGDRSVGLYGMSGYRSDGAAEPARPVVGFCKVAEHAIRRGIAADGDLLG